MHDIRFALRMLRRSPAFTLVAVIAIALGVGAVSTIFGAAETLLLKPAPGVGDPAGVVAISRTEGSSGGRSFSYPLFRDLRARSRALDGVAAFTMARAVMSLTPQGEGEQLVANIVSGNFFQVLRVRAAAGRFFVAEEDRTPLTHPVAVISHRLWQSRFAGSADVVGREVLLNGRTFTIVGVAAPEFGGTLGVVHIDLYVPIMMQGAVRGAAGGGESAALFDDWRGSWLQLVGRLREGASAAEASSELGAAARELVRAHGGASLDGRSTDASATGVRVDPLRGVPPHVHGVVMGFMGVLLAVAALVLLIASMNVANMLLARATARGREVAVRVAIGARPGRLVRQLLSESLALWLLGGAAGVLLAVVGTRLLSRFAPTVDGVAVRFAFGVDAPVLAFALLSSLVTGLAFGLAPAMHAARRDLSTVLRSGAGAGDPRRRTRNGFVVAQLAMSVLLLVAAGLFLRALDRGRTMDPGFAVDGLTVAPLELGKLGYDGPRAQALYARLAERLAAVPGVQGVAYTSLVPLGMNDAGTTLQVPGHRPPPGMSFTPISFHDVSRDYFRVMRMPIVRGRGFGAEDGPGAPQAFARRYWPKGDAAANAIAKTITLDGKEATIVGVARDARMRSLHDAPEPFLFRAAEQHAPTGTNVLVRAEGVAGGAAAVAALVRREARALESRMPVPALQTLEEAISVSLLPQRAAAAVTGVLGATGLLLATLGLYGVVAYSVSRRTREIGVRMAIGASPAAVVRLVVGQGARLAGVGVVVGVGIAALAARAIAPFLFGVSPFDPVTLGLVPLVLGAVAVAASWAPARRATRVGAAVALRSE